VGLSVPNPHSHGGVILQARQAVFLFKPGNYVPAFREETAE
jgi:hypothetical protein